MRTLTIAMCAIGAYLSSLVVVGSDLPARAADVPSYFKEIVGTQTASPAEIGTKNTYSLNDHVRTLRRCGQLFKKNILAQHPLILGLFSGAGGRFILYHRAWRQLRRHKCRRLSITQIRRPQHMALTEVVAPYLNSPTTWPGVSLAAYRNRMQSALDGLDATAMQDNWRPNNRSISRTISRSWTSV